MNLMINAIQAMPKGGTLTVDAKEDPEGTVRVDIRDTGLGIEPEALEHIFEPFFTTKEVGKGTGLGLSVCYSLVKRHGGRIEVRSTPGQGTVFSVLLPATRLEEADKQ
jgi:signal transduction histidine kinase